MMFLTNTTPTKQARNICLVKRGYRQIELYGCTLCYTWQFLTTYNAILCNAIIDTGRCCFKFFGCNRKYIYTCGKYGNQILECSSASLYNP